ncbi:MAG: phosphate ABC transporter substrate-binding protein PstS [Acidobacteriaceae bacterium]|nr:phosphate ABC transporter substrate-binding protein PstS [Acidobacteriaceae bacterium]MBV8570113.1 phosphate ABC transporter substrate-binding protein PstS [Acidobacteriaceae bacterium]
MRSVRGNLAVLTAISAASAALPLHAQVSLTGAGATFPAPIYQKWFNQYQSIGHVQINYQAIGSGGGIKSVSEGTVDFGASDAPLTDQQLENYKQKHGGHAVLLFPTVLGAAVPSYNIPGVKEALNFTPEALAGIYLGTITKWNDKAIASANPGVKLPNLDIVVLHRSEGSGTTYCWTDYLSKISPAWKSKVGKNTSVDWPVGLGAKGNDGVAGLLKQQQGAIGYIELIYAVNNNIAYGKVKNASGDFVKADLASVTAAAAALKEMPADFRVSITNENGPGAYPISTFTWLLVPSSWSDQSKKNAMVGFLKWAITSGQSSVESLQYAKLPASVVTKEQAQINLIK